MANGVWRYMLPHVSRAKQSIAKFWRWFVTPPSSVTLWRRAAWSLWLTPPILGFPLLLPILEPASIPGVLANAWEAYLLLFGLPFALGAVCWICARYGQVEARGQR